MSSHAQLKALKKSLCCFCTRCSRSAILWILTNKHRRHQDESLFQFALFLCSYSLTNSCMYVVKLVHFCFCSAKLSSSCHNLLCKVIASYSMFSFFLFFHLRFFFYLYFRLKLYWSSLLCGGGVIW